MTAPVPARVTARPVVATRLTNVLAVAVFVLFVVIAIVEPHANAGAAFNTADRIGTVIIGVFVALLITVPARPRVVADLEGIRIRQFLGGWRTVPWDLVARVEFPSSVRFARIVLPGDETIGLYAIQRLDGERAVPVMAGLRSLHAATHPARPA